MNLAEELRDLKKEIKISGFESTYLAVLFTLLGISLPIFLFKQELLSQSSLIGLMAFGLFFYTPFIIVAVMLYFFSFDSVIGKELSFIMTVAASIFIALFAATFYIQSLINIFKCPAAISILFILVFLIIFIYAFVRVDDKFKELYSESIRGFVNIYKNKAPVKAHALK